MRGSKLQIINQPCVTNSRCAQCYQGLPGSWGLQVTAAAHGEVVGLPALGGESRLGLGFQLRQLGCQVGTRGKGGIGSIGQLAQGKVQRIELLLLPEPAAAGSGVFERVVALLQASLGPALLAGDVASWVAGGVDVAAYRTASAQGPQVRVVYKTRELRDASAL